MLRGLLREQLRWHPQLARGVFGYQPLIEGVVTRCVEVCSHLLNHGIRPAALCQVIEASLLWLARQVLHGDTADYWQHVMLEHRAERVPRGRSPGSFLDDAEALPND